LLRSLRAQPLLAFNVLLLFVFFAIAHVWFVTACICDDG
jgi:hypothetical protein